MDFNRTRKLALKLGHNVTVISESGKQLRSGARVSHFANGFLIGSVMAHDDLHAAVRRVLLGEISLRPDAWARC
ncbi:hypothetical protein ACVXG7_11700 [Enterobacter hormaechei]